VGGIVYEVDWLEEDCVEGADSCVYLLLAVLPHVRANQGILRACWSSAYWCEYTQLSRVYCIAHGEEHSRMVRVSQCHTIARLQFKSYKSTSSPTSSTSEDD
jgi:hypothetical protein